MAVHAHYPELERVTVGMKENQTGEADDPPDAEAADNVLLFKLSATVRFRGKPARATRRSRLKEKEETFYSAGIRAEIVPAGPRT